MLPFNDRISKLGGAMSAARNGSASEIADLHTQAMILGMLVVTATEEDAKNKFTKYKHFALIQLTNEINEEGHNWYYIVNMEEHKP